MRKILNIQPNQSDLFPCHFLIPNSSIADSHLVIVKIVQFWKKTLLGTEQFGWIVFRTKITVNLSTYGITNKTGSWPIGLHGWVRTSDNYQQTINFEPQVMVKTTDGFGKHHVVIEQDANKLSPTARVFVGNKSQLKVKATTLAKSKKKITAHLKQFPMNFWQPNKNGWKTRQTTIKYLVSQIIWIIRHQLRNWLLESQHKWINGQTW